MPVFTRSLDSRRMMFYHQGSVIEKRYFELLEKTQLEHVTVIGRNLSKLLSQWPSAAASKMPA